MKKSIWILLLLAATSFHGVRGQNDTADNQKLPRASIKITPLHFFSSTFQFGTEIFNTSYSRSFNLDIGLKSSSFSYDEAFGFTTEVGFRKYVKPMTYQEGKRKGFHQGIYYNFYLQGGYFEGEGYYDFFFDFNPEDINVTIVSISPGFYIGLQRTLWEVMFLDVYVGGGYRASNIDYTLSPSQEIDYDITEPGYKGIYPRLGLKLGIGL